MALLGEDEFHREIAKSAAELVNALYEFSGHRDEREWFFEAITEPLEALDELLVEAGYRPEPKPLDIPVE